ncbi:MAG: tetratricopeptide repeat protein [Candidatus Hodarchaeota archaeon]
MEFFSFSAIFDVADLLLETIKENFQELPMGEERVAITSKVEEPLGKTMEEVDETPSEPTITEDELTAEESVQIKVEKESITDKTDKLLKKIEMPYSKGGFAGVYYTIDGKFAVVLFEKETPLLRKKYSKEKVNQDDLVDIISEAKIEFLSFSAIYDSAEIIENIILHPEEHAKAEAEKTPSVIPSEPSLSDDTMIVTSELTVSEDEIAMIDLSAFDASEYTQAKDFDKFLLKVTEHVEEGQPLPIKELDIEKSGGTTCIILRQMDNWFLRFRYKNGSLSDIEEVKVDQDAIAKAINKRIPQISFSYLYDASERVFLAIKQFTGRPMSEVILNVAIGHFLKVIEQHEADGDLKAAAKVTEVLFKRSREEKNPKGMLQFGKKLLINLIERKKTSKAIKLRNELAEELLEIDPEHAQIFVLDSLDSLAEEEKFLDAANLCGLLLDHYLAEEEDINRISNILMLAKKQVNFYKQARLPVVMWENALRYAHYTIRVLGKADAKDIETQKEACRTDILFLLDSAFEVHEERKSHFELLESLETTLNLLKKANDKQTYSIYIDRLILTADTQNRKEKALDFAIDASKFLMDPYYYTKACDLGNQAIKFFYELNRIESAVEFSLEIVRGLIDLKEPEAARDYLKFVEQLIDKAYADNESLRIEKQLTLGDFFGKLGDRDHGKSYIQKALQSIKDPKKREKIVLKYVEELLASKAILTAQEMTNIELSRLLNENKFNEVSNFCKTFITQLKEYQEHNMAFDYMRYLANLMIQTDFIDYKLLFEFSQDLLEINAFDHAAYMLDQLVTLQTAQKDYTRAIDSLHRFIDYLLANTDRYDLVKKYIFQTAESYRQMGDPEGALERLIGFQKDVIEYSIELAQNITDTILKELEQKEEYETAIEIVSRVIKRQMELEMYQDAYIFCVQNARYHEGHGIENVIKYLDKMRELFIKHEQYDDASQMTDLIIRYGRSHQRYQLVISSVKDYSKLSLDRGDIKVAVKFARDMASLLIDDNKGDKALEFLQMVFNTAYESDREAAFEVFEKILEIRASHDNFQKIAKKYLDPLFQKITDIDLLELVKTKLNPPIEDFTKFLEKIYDRILESDEVSIEMAEAIVDFNLLVYDEMSSKEGDRLADKYSTMLIDIEQAPSASRLMASVLEKTERPLTEVLPNSLNFVKFLISRSFLEGARSYIDRVIKRVSTTKKFGNEGRMLAAKLSEKFSIFVAAENPDLASEYAYQASDFYRSLNDFEGVVTVYSTLADQYSSSSRVIRTYKRGINICKKYRADKCEAKLLTSLAKHLIITKNSVALSTFQQTLEKYENLEDLEELFNVILLLIESAIEVENLDIVYPYLDYVCRLSSMINAPEKVGGILFFLLRHAEALDDKNKIEQIQKYVMDLGVKLKKYKKAYSELVERQKIRLKEIEVEPLIEVTEEIEPLPELVETSEIIPPASEILPEKVSQEMVEDIVDEEVVNVIKTFEQDLPEQIQPEFSEPSPDETPIIPDLSQLIEPIEQIEQEIPSETVRESPQPDIDVKEEIVAPVEDALLEAPIPEEVTVQKNGALSDEEVATLFSMEPSTRKEIPPSEIDLPLEESIPPDETLDEERIELSEKEIHDLFSTGLQTYPEEEIQSKATEIIEDTSVEDQWEVDAFGRLWKKGEIPPPSEDHIPETPDMSMLEEFIKEEEERKSVSPSEISLSEPLSEAQIDLDQTTEVKAEAITKEVTLEEEISESSVFGEKLPSSFSSVVDSLTEDEQSQDVDIFGVPEVSYEELAPQEVSPEKPRESQVQPPDLADLFSDALSELSSIGGESGESPIDTKKDKKRK